MRPRPFGAAMAVAVALLLLTAGCGGRTTEPPAGGTGTSGSGLRVSDFDVGRSLNADKTINDNDKTGSFKPNETVYLSIETDGSAPSATVTAKWTYQDGQVVDESTQTIAPSGKALTEFHISKPDGWPPGKYKVQVLLNGSPAGTKDFEVGR